MSVQNPKKAILFLNLGGPEKPADVKPFLFRLFCDPEIIRIGWTPLRKFVAWMIAAAREKKAQAHYALIGGGSPIRRLTDQQAAAVQSLLKTKGLLARVQTAFNCSEPLVENVVQDLASAGVESFLSFPLYPQYSFTTSKSALARARAAVKRFAPVAALHEISAWHLHPLFIQAHAELIRAQQNSFSIPQDRHIHLVFSAHSIPESLVTKRGDPYREQMRQTVAAVLKQADWKGPWTLCWQSKLGPVKWLSPSAEETIRTLGREETKQVLVVPIAFVSDHIETLVELDMELAETAEEAGIAEFKRVPGLNTHATFIAALSDIAAQQKEFWS